jgi:hypothetical protein
MSSIGDIQPDPNAFKADAAFDARLVTPANGIETPPARRGGVHPFLLGY